MKNILKKFIKDERGVGGLRRFVIGLLFAVVFSFILILFITQFLNETNPSSELLGDKYNLNNSMVALNNSMTDFQTTVNETQSILADSDTSKAGVVLFLIFQGAFDIPRAILLFLGSGVASISGFIFGAAGNQGPLSLVVPLFIAGIVITGVFLIVKAIRTGESEY
jgi:hypothetical protein